MMNKLVVFIGGPTASGKTGLSIELAKRFSTVIISADSRQMYKEMSIGTAKPDLEELNAVKHFLVDDRSIQSPMNAGDFEREALEIISSINKEVIFVVGGTGLYMKALYDGLDEFPEVPDEIRHKWNQLFEDKGLDYLQSLLKEKDPEYYESVDLDNPRRLIRALEVIEVSGEPYSSFRSGSSVQRDFRVLKLALDVDREHLYHRINERMDKMIEKGLFKEAESLFDYRELQPLKTVGYQEIMGFLEKEYDYEETVRLLKRNSRRYAKRQMTWFRREEFEWVDSKDINKIEMIIKTELEKMKEG
ncbi:tRNA (adenosine(37)-N6)-dimethylallyltransferase MiaA [Marinigracilibium pacificum]|uniref:tRNA dimethylallyltransferase n=1 Tax=Marinigracilibium pacificum TaxID=2729599 RepID=A0A848J0G3_9BACT|nr:tRNA (adenosine(37)-N6)-dimethylallyltransferase MiaA [Marinigracilibium pacificum]NMM49151.1 tRNA (adenosine(37)-N6)-dimethylallyltransferase MiaA [Marinigracilibium pacificum]